MASNGLLVFAGAEVGLETLGFLLERGEPVRRVVAAGAADGPILALAARAGVAAVRYGPDTQARLRALAEECDWLLNLWSPHLLRPPLLAAPRRRLNLHPGLTPHGRGNDCAAWAIRDGAPAGVSLLEMTPEIDAGAVWARREVAYEPTTRGGELQARLKRALADLFMAEWPRLAGGAVTPSPQSGPAGARRRAETNRDRQRSGEEIDTLANFTRWALAHDFAPGVTSELRLGERRYRLRLTLEEIQAPERAER